MTVFSEMLNRSVVWLAVRFNVGAYVPAITAGR